MLVGSLGWVRQPTWSPDGNFIAFVRATSDTNRDGLVNAVDFEELVVYDLINDRIIPIEGSHLEHFDPVWYR